MRKLTGIGASEGIAVARLWRIRPTELTVSPETGKDPLREGERFAAAQEKAIAELSVLYEEAALADPETAMIFDVHRMMLEDPDFCDGVAGTIAEGSSAEWAVTQSARLLREMFESMEDEYMRGRAADIQDVSLRVIRILRGVDEAKTKLTENVIVTAEDLLPSQTVKLDKEHVAGYVTRFGSVTSHSAILARTMGIPCIVGVGEAFEEIPEEGVLAIDGSDGEIIVDPDEEVLAEYRRKQSAFAEHQAMLREYRDRPALTKSGHKVLVCANIGSVEDAAAAAETNADGIGLFRSEFLYLDSPDFPSEETQFQVYKQVLEKLSPKPVVIRTLDLGSDKQAPYFNIPDEENPAMGYRAIRICLAQPEIFRTQLRALYRASVYGTLCIMFPMITGLSQVKEIKEIARSVREELQADGIPFREDVSLGIMIETPAAAVMSDVLAKEVDFFSIGTNDLTQYTLAADRMNARVSRIFNAEDPAVLRMIEMTARSAHAAGIWVGICGEAGANTALTPFFMDLGIDELSVAPASVLKVRKAVCDCK